MRSSFIYTGSWRLGNNDKVPGLGDDGVSCGGIWIMVVIGMSDGGVSTWYMPPANLVYAPPCTFVTSHEGRHTRCMWLLHH